MKIILRWLAVLPSAIIGLFIGSIVTNIWFQFQAWLIGNGPEGGFAKIGFWVVSSVFGGMLSVYWAARVAPTHRREVAVIITLLVVLFAIISFRLSYGEGWFWPLLSSTALICGAGYSILIIDEREKTL